MTDLEKLKKVLDEIGTEYEVTEGDFYSRRLNVKYNATLDIEGSGLDSYALEFRFVDGKRIKEGVVV